MPPQATFMFAFVQLMQLLLVIGSKDVPFPPYQCVIYENLKAHYTKYENAFFSFFGVSNLLIG